MGVDKYIKYVIKYNCENKRGGIKLDINKILNMNIFKVWAKFVLASIVGVVLNTIYVIVDGMFVGQGVGEVGLASLNIAWPAVTVVIGTGLMIGIGTSSIMSIHIGKEEKEEAEQCLSTAVKLILILGSIIMIIGLIFKDPILRMLGATSDTIDYAKQYFTIIYIITIPYIFSTALNPIVRADGRPDLSMMMIGIGAIINIILDYILVIKLGCGVIGAALATSISIFISMTVSLYYFIRGSSKIKIKIKKIYSKGDKKIVKEILKIGFASFAIQFSYGIIIFIQNKAVYEYAGTIGVAIYCVATYVNCLLVNTCTGIAQGVQPLIGYHYGAKKMDRMKQLIKITIFVCVIGGILFLIGLYFYGREVITTFGVEQENLEYAYKQILIYCMASPIIGIVFTMGGFYQALGKNIYANILAIGRGFVFQFIFTITLPRFIGSTGVFLSLPLADVITFGILIFMIFKEKSKEHKVGDLIETA